MVEKVTEAWIPGQLASVLLLGCKCHESRDYVSLVSCIINITQPRMYQAFNK